MVTATASAAADASVLGGAGGTAASAAVSISDSFSLLDNAPENHRRAAVGVSIGIEEVGGEQTLPPRPDELLNHGGGIRHDTIDARDVDWTISRVRRIHEECFPLRYDNKFYTGLANGWYGKRPLFTRIAVTNEGEHIVAEASAQIFPACKVGDRWLLDPSDDSKTHYCYLLTMAVENSWRKRGIASSLLNACIDYANSRPECGLLYLHVITYNTSAMAFYEANGFRRICTVRDFYNIEKKKYDAYVYARYLENARPPPLGVWETILSWFGKFKSLFYVAAADNNSSNNKDATKRSRESRHSFPRSGV